MITEEELQKVNALRELRWDLDYLLQSFKSPYVSASVGIIDLNSASRETPKPSDQGKFFHKEMKPLVVRLNKVVRQQLKLKIASIDVELGRYVQPEKKRAEALE